MHLTRALVPFLTLSFLTSAAPSSSNLYIREAEAKTSTEISDPLIPPSWLSQRSPLGLIALGDDGVLRNLRLRIPSTPQRHDHLNPARHEVLAAISLSPLQIKHFVDKAPLNDKAKLHFHQFFTGVNGHDVQRKGLMAPDPKLLPRSPGTVAQARVMKERALNEEREEGGLIMDFGVYSENAWMGSGS
ncbi:hypothetical protein MMC30_005573 [Trapelia coarctata]|nr:hypothetical protein [Trapelia coarctata]